MVGWLTGGGSPAVHRLQGTPPCDMKLTRAFEQRSRPVSVAAHTRQAATQLPETAAMSGGIAHKSGCQCRHPSTGGRRLWLILSHRKQTAGARCPNGSNQLRRHHTYLSARQRTAPAAAAPRLLRPSARRTQQPVLAAEGNLPGRTAAGCAGELPLPPSCPAISMCCLTGPAGWQEAQCEARGAAPDIAGRLPAA